jgi:hypothetical protein
MAGLNVYQQAREQRALVLIEEAADIIVSIRKELGLGLDTETQDHPEGSDERRIVDTSNHLGWTLVADTRAWAFIEKAS